MSDVGRKNGGLPAAVNLRWASRAPLRCLR